ncbi:galactose oxidase [Gigaspora margarita]|uniref:Galactose oxidase n=1 Tax=Gigaspora margarita TaxID=4874 RepID=A0A8H4AB41_GIGMA|nr:galactose oxidase [Gigaspora margarita]
MNMYYFIICIFSFLLTAILAVTGLAPGPRLWPAAVLVNNKLYIIGGLPNNDSFYLDVSKNFNVSDMASMPWTDISTGAPRKDSISACIGGMNNDSIFVIGNKPSASFQPLVSQFDTTKQTWSNVTASGAPPVDRYYISCASFGKGLIAIFSGAYVTGNDNNDLWLFNTLSLSWIKSNATTAPAARSGYCAITLPDDNILYIGGSYNFSITSLIPMNILPLYNTKNDSWSNITTSGQTPPSRRFSSAVLTPNKRILMFGGVNDASLSYYNDLWILDISTYQWSTGNITNPSLGPSNLYDHTATVVGNYMFVCFGTNSQNYPTPTNSSSKIYVLDISKNDSYQWVTDFSLYPKTTTTTMSTPTSTFTPTPTSTPSHSAASKINTSLYLIIGLFIEALFLATFG